MRKHKSKRIGWFWAFVALAGMTAAVLGIVGLRRSFQEGGQTIGGLDFIYAMLQMFKGGLQLPLVGEPFKDNPALRVARVLAPVVVLAITGRVGWLLLSTRIKGAFCRWKKGHVVICGLGHKGRILALRFLERKTDVVVVEIDALNAAVLEIRARGAQVLMGNAADSESLLGAGAGRASYVFAVTSEDETNLEIAHEISSLRAQHVRENPVATGSLKVFAHVESPELRELFKRHPPFCRIDAAQKLEARIFDCAETAARTLVGGNIGKLTCHRSGDPGPAFLICGQGPFVEELVRQIITNAHFANNRKPAITVLTTDPKLGPLFQRRYPQLALVGEVRFIEVTDHRLFADDLMSVAHPPLYDLAAVSLPSDVDTFGWAEQVARLGHIRTPAPDGTPPLFALRSLVACLLPSSSLAALEPGRGLAAKVVSLAEQGCDLDILLHGELDQEARRLHERYCASQLQQPPKERSPLCVPWEELPEAAREDNRSAALHGNIKRFARSIISSEDPGLRERLAEAEHARWMAVRIMGGWRPGRRDDEAKRHPNIVPYGELSEPIKEYDRHNVDEAWAAAVSSATGAKAESLIPAAPPKKHPG